MIALAEIFSARWACFLGTVIFFLALDLGVFHRRAHVVRFREALGWTTVWFLAAMAFAWTVAPQLVDGWGLQETNEFVTGYVLELSLSMDNVFVIALIFSYFRVPQEYQHRVLFWGIFGALVMRGLMIGAGVALVQQFHWLLYALGVFLVVTGIKMCFGGEAEVHPERNLAIRLARKLCPVSAEFDGQKFFTHLPTGGSHAGIASSPTLALTPLALVLLMVETTDLIFAVDSIPAIFGVTTNSYVIFTSNVFAILGLRSLYFVLAGAIALFRYLKYGLAVVLAYIGIKMLVANWWTIPTGYSLGVVIGIIVLSVVVSLLAAARERKTPPPA
ncbi:MAG: TerC family protein [Verrucomicrobia bacterium]|nr:TerC family protein [Verrucomicrobiota bacterium]